MSVSSKSKSTPGWKLRKIEGAYCFNECVGKAQCAEKNQQFRDECGLAGVEPTPRQYAKWSKRVGKWTY